MQIRTILYLCFRIAMVLMFLLGVIGWQITDFWKAAHVLKNFHMLVPKRACMDLNLCCTCVQADCCWFTTRTFPLMLSYFAHSAIVRGSRMQVQQITSRQADSQDLASPSNMPYNNPKISIQLVVAPSEYKKKGFPRLCRNKDRNTILLRNSSEGL